MPEPVFLAGQHFLLGEHRTCPEPRVRGEVPALLLGWRADVRRSAYGDDEPPMSSQLADLGRQALAQGANRAAETFFKQSLELDPENQDAATDGLERGQARRQGGAGGDARPAEAKPGDEAKPAGRGPAQAAPATDTPPPPPPGDDKATLEQTQAAENITRQN